MPPTTPQPVNPPTNPQAIERALESISRAVSTAFGSGAQRLGKVTNTATVVIATTSTALFTALSINVAGGRTIRIYIIAANIIGGVPASDRARFDVLVDGVVVGRTYTGTANLSGRILECDVAVSNGAHTITCYAIKDVGTGTVSFYADGAGAAAYLIAEIAN